MSDVLATDDLVLARLLEEARRDEETIALVLGGSRGAGLGDADSDDDLIIVLTDDAYDRRKQRGERLGGKTTLAGRSRADDLGYSCPRALAAAAARPDWRTYGLVASQVLLDKTGDVTRLLAALARVPVNKAQADAAGWFDAYLNAFYRSLKAWRRGNVRGAHLQAAESIAHLLQTLFFLEGQWPPYKDYLGAALERLHGQGWDLADFQETVLHILRTADPVRQQTLEGQVERLLRARGFGHVVDAWEGEIERVKSFRFDGTPR